MNTINNTNNNNNDFILEKENEELKKKLSILTKNYEDLKEKNN